MESKYYTPSIEEFHVGFEYEEKSSGLWAKQIYNNYSPVLTGVLTEKYKQFRIEHLYNFDTIENYIQCELIRVKYLDKEDIESLGWKVVENVGNTEFEMGLNYIMWFNKTDKNDLTILRRTELIQPRNPPIIHNQWEGLFSGIIKNKSELKKLMKQLQIEC